MAPRTPKTQAEPPADQAPDTQAATAPPVEPPAEPPVAPENVEPIVDTSAAPVELPASVTLTAPYGYVDDNGQILYWQPGEVTDADQVADLIARKAPLAGYDFKNHE